MKLQFFKRKIKPNPEFTTIEVEYAGVTYGYCLNWFKKDNNGSLTEVKIPELPEALLSYRADDILRSVKNDLDAIMEQFKQSVAYQVGKLSQIIDELEEPAEQLSMNQDKN